MNELYAVVIVLLTVWVVFWLNRQDRKWIKTVLNWFPAILFAYVIPALCTHLFKLELTAVYLHTLSKEWIIPVTIFTVMSALSFQQLRIVGLRPILLFVSGSLAIATLPVILVALSALFVDTAHATFMDEKYWMGLVPIVGGWIGGSTSQLVLKELVGTPESMFLSVLVLDNILVNLWTILMFQFIKRSDDLNKRLGIKDEIPEYTDTESHMKERKSLITLLCIIIVSVIVALSVKQFIWQILSLSLLGLVFGNVIRVWNHKLVLKLGGILIIVIMAILGLKLNFSSLSLPPIFIGVVLVWIVLHYVVMVAFAWIFRIHMAWVPIASMANLGGISTAPAVTSAYNKEWMPHAILLAILSMVTGTLWGMATIYLFGWI